jgi:hypothetical protein
MIDMLSTEARRMLRTALGIALLCPATVLAQADPGLVNHRNDCRLAAQVLTKGEPANKTEWARGLIVSCNEELPATLTTALRNARTSSDLSELGALRRGALYVRDADFFDAALDVAGDRSASVRARAASVLIAAMQLRERITFDFGAVLSATHSYSCLLEPMDHSLRTGAGRAIPADARLRLGSLADALLADGGTPLPVKTAARCAREVLETRN